MAKWTAHNNVDQSIAKRAFSFQKSFHSLPPLVMAAARRIREYKYSPEDVDTVANALGIQHSGYRAAKQQFQQLSSISRQAGQIGVLINAVSQGGATGMAAGAGLAGVLSQNLDKLGRSKQFQDALQAWLVKYVKNAEQTGKTGIIGRAIEKATGKSLTEAGESALGPQIGYAISRLGRIGLKAVIWGQVAEAAARIGSGGLNIGLGKEGGEPLRLARSERDIALADTRNYSGAEASLAQMKAVAETNRARWAEIPIPGFTDFGRAIYNRAAGVGAERLGMMQTQINAFKAGGVEAKEAWEEARRRALNERYGFVGSKVMDLLPRSLDSESLSRETASLASSSIARRGELRGKAFEATQRGQFETAEEYFKQAEAEVGAKKVWENPAELWTNMVVAAGATRMWARSNMARAGPRTGD